MYFKILLISLVEIILIKHSLACNGFKAKLTRYENCGGPDQIVTIEDGFKIKLNKKCELVPEGCVQIKGFKTAIASYKVTKDLMKLSDERDVNICEMVARANDDERTWMKLFALPENCPVEEGKVCTKGQTVSIAKYKNMLSFVRGTIIINATIQHENDGISCFLINVDITK